MQNKKLIIIMSLIVLLVGAAAFIAGKLLNQGVNPLGMLPMVGGGKFVSVAVNVNPAPELPTTAPEVTGLFVERNDNSIMISSISLPSGGGGVVVGGPDVQTDSGPKVEVVITSETVIYRETTEFNGPPSENETIQQTVEESTLDDLNAQSFVTVWGRKSGDRIIAEVVFVSTPVMIKRP